MVIILLAVILCAMVTVGIMAACIVSGISDKRDSRMPAPVKREKWSAEDILKREA